MKTVSKKIVLMGDFAVGKTSLVRRFVDDSFSETYLTTIGVTMSRKKVELSHEKQMLLLIWDVEGATPAKPIPKNYLMGAAAAIIVADVTRPETMQSVREHIEAFIEINKNAVIVLAYNKSDLIDPDIPVDALTHPSLIGTFLTSAKTGDNVMEMFKTIASHVDGASHA